MNSLPSSDNPFLDPIDPYAPILTALNLTHVDHNCGNGGDDE